MKNFAQQLFFGLLVESLVVLLAYFSKDQPLVFLAVLAAGTIIAGIVAFRPTIIVDWFSGIRDSKSKSKSKDLSADRGSVSAHAKTRRGRNIPPSTDTPSDSQIAIDLGTVNVRVYVPGRGIVVDEPSVVAVSVSDNTIVAVGEEAQSLLGREPKGVKVLHLVQRGVIADNYITPQLLHYLLKETMDISSLQESELMFTIPQGATDLHRQAMREAAFDVGAGRVCLVPAPLAAALGAGLPIDSPRGCMVVGLGGGISEVSIIAMKGVVDASSIPVGGVDLDEQIIRHVLTLYGVRISQEDAESVKTCIGAAIRPQETLAVEIPGQDRRSGRPLRIQLVSDHVSNAIHSEVWTMVEGVRAIVKKASPELLSDIVGQGIVLVGGTALLPGIDELIAKETGVPTRVAEDPMWCTILGAGKMMEPRYKALRSSLMEE